MERINNGGLDLRDLNAGDLPVGMNLFKKLKKKWKNKGKLQCVNLTKRHFKPDEDKTIWFILKLSPNFLNF